jgi:hypothetical protein
MTSQKHLRILTTTLLATVTLLSGCGSQPKAVGLRGKEALKGKTLAIATPSSAPDFTYFSPGKVALGIPGEAWMRAAGARIVVENRIADPAVAVAGELAQSFHAALGTVHAANAIESDDRSPSVLSAKAAGAGLVLYTQTYDWRMWYYTTNFNRYRARVVVSATLVDTTTQKVLGSAKCDEQSPNSPDVSATSEEMVADGAKRLKQELATAQAACVARLKQRLLGS